MKRINKVVLLDNEDFSFRDIDEKTLVYFETAPSIKMAARNYFTLNRLQAIPAMASFDKATLLKDRRVLPSLEKNLRKIEVPTFTFRQLLEKYNIADVLLLQIDTEEYDFELLKHIASLGIHPRLIQYEHKHLSFSDQSACRTMLSNLGYSFLTKQEDSVAIYQGQAIYP